MNTDPSIHRYALLLSYKGTSYCGWQTQRGTNSGSAPSIQNTIETVLERMVSEKASVVGSGRTDSGVHAAGQVAHITLRKKAWESRILIRGLNTLLPPSIRVLGAQEVDPEFHAQRSAERKQYSFYLLQGPAAPPFLAPYTWHIHRKLNIKAMQEALNALVGEHDFKPFQARGSKILRTTVRTLYEAEVTREPIQFPGGLGAGPETPWNNLMSLVRIRLVGSGFLKQMVRGIVGTLVQVGEEKRPSSCMSEILQLQDRKLLGATAPGHGLWLERVWYPNLSWKAESFGLKPEAYGTQY